MSDLLGLELCLIGVLGSKLWSSEDQQVLLIAELSLLDSKILFSSSHSLCQYPQILTSSLNRRVGILEREWN